MVEILLTVIVIYVLYYVLTIHKYNKMGQLKKKGKKNLYESLPKEAQFFLSFYHFDMEKLNIRALLNLLAVVLGISITFAIVLANYFTKDITLSIVLSAIFLIPIYLCGLKLVAMYLKKRG